MLWLLYTLFWFCVCGDSPYFIIIIIIGANKIHIGSKIIFFFLEFKRKKSVFQYFSSNICSYLIVNLFFFTIIMLGTFSHIYMTLGSAKKAGILTLKPGSLAAKSIQPIPQLINCFYTVFLWLNPTLLFLFLPLLRFKPPLGFFSLGSKLFMSCAIYFSYDLTLYVTTIKKL